jgi:hypothetical protein
MAYNIPRSDPNLPDIVVNDATTNTADTSIALLGRNAPNYGAIIAETQVHLLENFANSAPPANPIPGQLWYNNVAGTLFVNTGIVDGDTLAWTPVGSGGGSSTFVGLTDTPANYAGAAGQVVAVNAGGTGLEFTTITGAGEVNTASNIGAGTGTIFAQKTGVDLEFKSLVAGSGVTLTNNADSIQIDATGAGGGEVNTGANLGAGEGVFAQKNGVALEFKSLVAGTGVTITNTATELTINSTGGGGGLAAVVDDTSPQLGGVLETNGNWIEWENETVPAAENLQARFTSFGNPLFIMGPANDTPGGTNSNVVFSFQTNLDSSTPANNRQVLFGIDGNIRLTAGVTPANPADLATKEYVDNQFSTSTYFSETLYNASATSGTVLLDHPLRTAGSTIYYDQIVVEGFFPSAQLGAAYSTITLDVRQMRFGVNYAIGPAYTSDNTGSVHISVSASNFQTVTVNTLNSAQLVRVTGITFTGVSPFP